MSIEQITPISQPHGRRRAGAIVLFGLLLVSLGFTVTRVIGHEAGIIEGEDWLLGNSYLMAVWGSILWIGLLLWGNVNHRAALLFCLSLPGAIALPLLGFTSLAGHGAGKLGPLLMYMTFILYPGAFVLPLVAAIQAPRLRPLKTPDRGGGYLAAAGIVALYVWTSYALTQSM